MTEMDDPYGLVLRAGEEPDVVHVAQWLWNHQTTDGRAPIRAAQEFGYELRLSRSRKAD